MIERPGEVDRRDRIIGKEHQRAEIHRRSPGSVGLITAGANLAALGLVSSILVSETAMWRRSHVSHLTRMPAAWRVIGPRSRRCARGCRFRKRTLSGAHPVRPMAFSGFR